MSEFTPPNENSNVINASDRFGRRAGRTADGRSVPSNFAEIFDVKLPPALEGLNEDQLDGLTQLYAGLSSSDERTRDSYMAAVSQANQDGKLPDVMFEICAAIHYATDVGSGTLPPQA